MKTLTYIFIITLFLNCYAQNTSSWEILNEGKGLFGKIDFVSDDVGYAVVNGRLLKTVDGGESWDFVSQIANTVDGWAFTSEYNGWAVTNMGYGSREIAKTTDGGYTWQIQKESMDFDFRSIHVVSDSIVFAWEAKLITRTTDEGKNWTDIETPADSLYYTSVWFFNADSGIALCGLKNSYTGSIYNTFDGGQSWIKIQSLDYTYLGSLKFINDSTGYFLTGEYFCVTTDTLRTWTAYKNEYHSYTMVDEKTIVAVNQDKNLVYSTDTGSTWQILGNKDAGPPGPDLIYFNSSHDLYVIDQVGNAWDGIPVSNLWKSDDWGENWQQLIFSYPFNNVFFTDQQSSFLSYAWTTGGFPVSGARGGLFTTNDGGISWEKDIETGFIETCFFNDVGTGYLLTSKNYFLHGSLSTISKSIDSGENWFDVYTSDPDSLGYSFTGSDMDFSDEELGWVVGAFDSVDSDIDGACILETTDGAENWHKVWDNGITEWNDYSFNSIHTCDSTAWAVGNEGLIVKYSSLDKWQIQNSVTDLPLNKVFFSDEQHGWIAGGSYYWYVWDDFKSTLLKTINGGNSWKEIQFDKDIIRDMYFADSLHGWAVGEDTTRSYLGYNSGILLETFDGGENWIPVVENLSAPLKAIHFKDGTGWAVGDNGLILKTDGSTWVDQNTGKEYPSKFWLSQNYPNPFNPITKINYELPVTNYVDLSIYNLLGQKVATLVDKKQAAGSYQVQWDASAFASGIYIYQLKAKGQRENAMFTKKLVLLK